MRGTLPKWGVYRDRDNRFTSQNVARVRRRGRYSVVVPAPVHPAIVVVKQVVWVIVATVKLLIPPDINDIERETVWVQMGTAMLPIHEDELKDVLDNDPSVEEEFVSSSNPRPLPISARVSIKT